MGEQLEYMICSTVFKTTELKRTDDKDS